MSLAAIDPTGALLERPSISKGSRRFSGLRGVYWRIDLGILASSDSDSASIDDLRRATADSRRRYAALRRQLLVDPHVPKDGSSSPDLLMDNPLSQSPDSMWGRFFKNAELERMLDQDLTRLYPEDDSYFQSSACQCMLRRILLLWCLRHPEYGYRQGMHELLAPLLYVLHVDALRLSEARKTHEDNFSDKFDRFSFHENNLKFKLDFEEFSGSSESLNSSGKSSGKAINFSELDAEMQTLVSLGDAYGAEGELGVVLSEKFMEHDAYCMFEALMNGSGGAVVMAEFFTASPFGISKSGFSPVIEASAALYHLLSIVDSSLHSHLVELGVEPQYFALRWLRVLFGREFALDNLLIIWDEIFACANHRFVKSHENGTDTNVGVFDSFRGAFISSFAVSMILHLRSSLLATENATSCLQRLLNFPDDVNLGKLILKAKSLQALAIDANNSNPLLTHVGDFDRTKSIFAKCHSISLDLAAVRNLNFVSDSYWEEKWRDLHKGEEHGCKEFEIQTPSGRKVRSEKVKVGLPRTESAPSSSKAQKIKKEHAFSVRRKLLEDLPRQSGEDEDTQKLVSDKQSEEVNSVEGIDGDRICEDCACTSGQTCLPQNSVNEEHSSVFVDLTSPVPRLNNQENESQSSSLSVSIDGNGGVPKSAKLCGTNVESLVVVSDSPEGVVVESGKTDGAAGKPVTGLKERKPLSGKFQGFQKFARDACEGVCENSYNSMEHSGRTWETNQEYGACTSTADGRKPCPEILEGETVEHCKLLNLKNLGQSMLENVQAIQYVFQQGQAEAGLSNNIVVSKEEVVTAVSALKELQKIGNLLAQI